MRLSALAGSMRAAAGRTVQDKTGLEGYYEFTLQYASDPLVTKAPSYFTALSEQLGLRIVSDRGLVPVLVVEAISRPTLD